MVEIEIGVPRGQCLDRRIAERAVLEAEIRAWQRERNASGARVKWRFTTEKARKKLTSAYPDILKESKSPCRGTGCIPPLPRPNHRRQQTIRDDPRCFAATC